MVWRGRRGPSSDISSVLCDMIIMVCEAQVPAERVCWKDGNKCHIAVAERRSVDEGRLGGEGDVLIYT